MESDANDANPGARNATNADATQREAKDYWGYLIKVDKCGTDLFDRLLKGIADVIVSGRDYGASLFYSRDVPLMRYGDRARHSSPATRLTSRLRRSPHSTAPSAAITMFSS